MKATHVALIAARNSKNGSCVYKSKHWTPCTAICDEGWNLNNTTPHTTIIILLIIITATIITMITAITEIKPWVKYFCVKYAHSILHQIIFVYCYLPTVCLYKNVCTDEIMNVWIEMQ